MSIFSDHGQIGVIPDDAHSLRLAFPFEREIGHLFDALGLDVHDFPGEDPDCDAVVASNGGFSPCIPAENRTGRWSDPPEFDRDILPVGQAFWTANNSGMYASELKNALAGVLVRNVQEKGWYAEYDALTRENEIISLDEWFCSETKPKQFTGMQRYADPVDRLNNLVSPYVGDLLLISNYADGFYFGAPIRGNHGGIHPEDSDATLVFGFPGVNEDAAEQMKAAIQDAIRTRCLAEGGRQPSTSDLLTGLMAVLGSSAYP